MFDIIGAVTNLWVAADGRHAFGLALVISLAFVGYLINRGGQPSTSQQR